MRLRNLIIALALVAVPAAAGEKKLMHCFAWTAVKEATSAEWEAFYQASDALPSKIKGVTKVWYGRLVSPLNQTRLAKIDPEAFKKFQAGETVTAEVQRANREYGMCMEMADAAALKTYDSDPYHKIWTEAYAKVRVEGTTTFNIIGQ